MKKLSFGLIVFSLAVMTAPQLSSCKSKSDKNTTSNSADSTNASTTAPVDVSSDETLRNGVKDATKDYPTVTASVENGEVTLTGSLDRSKLPDLMQSINSLNPRKVNNQLTLN